MFRKFSKQLTDKKLAQEFIIAITEHRAVGCVLVPLLIQKEQNFYTIQKTVKLRDFKSGEVNLTEPELELLKLIENYSDEMLTKKFSRKTDKINFFQNIDADLFQKHISPYIEKYIYRCILLLMKGQTRLFNKHAKYANLYDEDEIRINCSFSESIFYFNRDENGTKYKLKISHEGKTVDLLRKTIKMISTIPCSFVLQNRLFVFEHLSGKRITPFLTKEVVSIPPQVEDKYYQTFLLNTIKESEVEAIGFEIRMTNPSRKTIISLEQDLRLQPVLSIKFRYDNTLYLAESPSTTSVNLEKQDGQYVFNKFIRDRSWEEEQLNILKEHGLRYKNGFWNPLENKLQADEDNYYRPVNWLANNKETLDAAGFLIVQNKLNKKYYLGKKDLDIQIKSQEDWFDIMAIVKFGDYHIPFIRLRRHIMTGLREFQLPTGEIVILPEVWFAAYKDFFPLSRLDGDIIKIRKHHYLLLQENLKLILEDATEIQEQIVRIPYIQAKIPENLNAELRNYQKDGFWWMHHLFANKFGACLADDMGLGKTIQTIALLLKVQRINNFQHPAHQVNGQQLSLFDQPKSLSISEIQPASLIVMPTSLVHNWANELQKFAPSLKVYQHIGSQREKTPGLSRAFYHSDVILTSYGTMRNDLELLSSFEYFYLILDESQYIKNSASKTYKSILELRAKHRLVLTGTPIENSLSDLWSQLNFLNKGLLGSLPYFKREFITPIEKKNYPQQQEKLQKLIRPFVLRRTKEEVANDLPALTEQIRYCEMTEEQREIYETEKSAIRNEVLKLIDTKKINKSALIILQGLTRLRQLANHPVMIDHEFKYESGKFNEIYRCLKNLLAENHKVLIFSSFVKHLELLQTKIELKNWKYSLLTGKTLNREEVIRQFQEDRDNHIFLISLKAGGVGLNLTSADYVFIIDPWWNPAAENQALSRAHRIGQDKKVFVYRFISENSIEEKIQTLKSKKSALAEKFISSNNPLNVISEDEILSLFS
ncbi:MAG TPA: SNF family helicase [Prolixibacteraceae bacterium]|nr:SNF family helicase [Prolixibacteraceae bacterium]